MRRDPEAPNVHPNTEMEEPIRQKLRKAKVLPRWRKSSTEADEPAREKLRRDNELPRWT
jgi:hypothetical protein